MTDAEVIKLIIDYANSTKDTEAVSTSLRELKSTAEQAGEKVEQLGKKSANTGQSLLQGGRVIQDFAQGGLGGILNNIEGLTMALGMGSGLAGVLTILGVVALTAGPSIKSFFQGLVDGHNAIPKNADAVAGLTEKLKANKDALEELHKKQDLTNTDLATYNKLTGENITLEKELTAAKKQRKVIEDLMSLRPAGAVEADKERSANLEAEIGGRQSQVVGEVAQGLKAREAATIDDEINKLWPAGKKWDELPLASRLRYQELTKRQVEHQRGMPADLTERAKGAVGRAVTEGNEASSRFVLGQLPPGSQFRGAFERSLPENVRAADKADEDFQAQLDERSAAVKRRNENRKKKAEADKKRIAADASTAADIDEAERMHLDDIAAARRMSNEVMRKGHEQRDRPLTLQPLKQIPMPKDATEVQAMSIMAANQIALDQSIRADKAELLRLAKQARGNINATRTAQSNGTP
jgi:hypothetical protein